MSKKTPVEGTITTPYGQTLVEEQIPASQFMRYPSNRVPGKEDVEAMAASIRENGQLQPVTARPVPNGEGGQNLEIVFGETRVLACGKLGVNFPVRCYVITLDDKEAAKIHAVENFQRKQLDEIDEARTMANMRENGWTTEEISRSVGKGVEFVYKRLSLLKLPEDAQQQIRDRNLSCNTAQLIAGLPEEQRAQAVAAVVTPKLSKKALPEREALEHIRMNFIEPAKKQQEWDDGRKALEKQYPGATWLEFKHASKCYEWDSNYERCDERPAYEELSDAAREEELVVPTWGELADRHGAIKYIGLRRNSEAALFVVSEPLIDAEKAACEDKPGDCIFPHAKAVAEARKNAERRKEEEKARREAIMKENQKAVDMVMTPGKPVKTAEVKLCEAVLERLISENEICLTQGRVFCYKETEDHEAREAEVKIKAIAFLKKKEISPFEALGRLVCASTLDFGCDPHLDYMIAGLGDMLFHKDAMKKTDFPLLAEGYAKLLKKEESQEKGGANE